MTVSVALSSEFLPEHNSSILFFWTDRWYEDNLAGVITELIQTDAGLASILLLDPVTVFSLRTSDLLAPKEFFQLNIELNCTSRGGPKQVDEKWLRDIWGGILQWVSIITFGACMYNIALIVLQFSVANQNQPQCQLSLLISCKERGKA